MPANPDSILDSVKKALGLDSEDTSFDLDVTMFINAVFGSLKQIGVGPSTGFMIVDNTTLWSQYVTNVQFLGMVKSYIFMNVKLVFDPPENRFGSGAYEKMIEETAWRILAEVESVNPPSDPFAAVSEPASSTVKAFFAPNVVELVYDSSITIDVSKGNVFYLTLAGDCVMFAPVNGVNGQHITLEVISNGHSISWRSGWDFGDQGTPSLSSGAKADIVSAYYKTAAAKWRAGFTSGFTSGS